MAALVPSLLSRQVAAPAESTLINRNITVRGRRTSVRLEDRMWDALEEICRREGKRLNQLVTEIDGGRLQSSLTSGIRVYVVDYFRAAASGTGRAANWAAERR